jgi:hypothetical protein
MYESNTILTLKEQRDPDPETGEVFPYNEVKVIGASPISHGGNGEWSGQAAVGVIIVPTANFGSTLDEPLGKVQALYDVKFVPVNEIEVAPKIRVYDSATAAAGQSPEEVFAEKAPGAAPAEGQSRGRTAMSPLADPRPAANDGPLGPVKKATVKKP